MPQFNLNAALFTMKVVLFVVLSVLVVSGEKARFDNYRVYSVSIDTQDQLSVLRQLSENSDSVRLPIASSN